MFKNSFLSSFSNKVRSSTLISIFRKRIDGKGKFERENEDERMLRTICSYYSLFLERLLNGASLHSLELNAKISRKRRGMNSRNIKPRRVLYLRFRKTISKRRERRRTLFFVLQEINFSLRILLFSSSMRIDDTSIDTRWINRGNPTFLSQNRDQFSIKVHTVWEKGELTSYRKKVAKICVYLAAFPKIARYIRDLS